MFTFQSKLLSNSQNALRHINTRVYEFFELCSVHACMHCAVVGKCVIVLQLQFKTNFSEGQQDEESSGSSFERFKAQCKEKPKFIGQILI